MYNKVLTDITYEGAKELKYHELNKVLRIGGMHPPYSRLPPGLQVGGAGPIETKPKNANKRGKEAGQPAKPAKQGQQQADRQA